MIFRIWVVSLALVAGGLASVGMRTDANWDLRNYHLFSAHAFLHGLTFHHVAAAQLQSFFNPLPSLPGWFLLGWLNGAPRLYALVMGLPAGLAGLLFGRVAWLHARAAGFGGPSAWAMTALTVGLGLSGATFMPAIGTSSGDMLSALPMLAAYLLVLGNVLRRDEGRTPRLGQVAVAAALAGLAAGLKLTMVIFAAPLGVMILLLLGPAAASAGALAMLAGFMAGWAPFAWVLWSETGNPVFPLYNHVFRSPAFSPVALADQRFLPRSTLQAVFYPFWWLRQTTALVTELPMRDPRIALGYVSAVLLLGVALVRGLGRAAWLALGVAALSFATWCHLFGIYRYLIVLELLAAILVMLALASLWRRRAVAALALLLVLSLSFTKRPDWGHVRFGPAVLAIEPMPVNSGALVLLVGGDPQSYLVPFMPDGVRAMGIVNNLIEPGAEHGLNRRIRAAIAAHGGEAWAVSSPKLDDLTRDRALGAYGFAVSGPCRLVRSNIDRAGHRFCPVAKAGSAKPG